MSGLTITLPPNTPTVGQSAGDTPSLVVPDSSGTAVSGGTADMGTVDVHASTGTSNTTTPLPGGTGLVRYPDGTIGTPGAGGLSIGSISDPGEAILPGAGQAGSSGSISDPGEAILPGVGQAGPTGSSAPTTTASGQSSVQSTSQQTPATSNSPGSSVSLKSSKDTRLRLNALNPSDVFTGILAVLQTTNGMLFPYTPQINFSQSVSYMDLQLTHSNTDYAAYSRTPSVTISVTGKFTVQNQAEGQYVFACLHFLRTASKMYFGLLDAQSGKAGLPPPVLVLNGYGTYMFNQLPVVLKSHSWSFDDSTDTIEVAIYTPGATTTVGSTGTSNTFLSSLTSNINNIWSSLTHPNSGNVRLPSLFSITCELMVVQTPKRMREQFSFDQFASGALLQGNSQPGWI